MCRATSVAKNVKDKRTNMYYRVGYDETVLCIDTLVYCMVCNIRRLSQLNGPFFIRRFINIVLRSETTNEKQAFVLKILDLTFCIISVFLVAFYTILSITKIVFMAKIKFCHLHF